VAGGGRGKEACCLSEEKPLLVVGLGIEECLGSDVRACWGSVVLQVVDPTVGCSCRRLCDV
jgi:hypothetical protein